ncbi:MAG: alpha/beta hydrolase family protein [Planctomycetota bacterium]
MNNASNKAKKKMIVLFWIILIICGLCLWGLIIAHNRKRINKVDSSGDPNKGIIIFVEPVRWLFIIWGFTSFVKGLRRGGCEYYIRLFRWSGKAGALMVLPDLMRHERLTAKSNRLLKFINSVANEHPKQTIHLCGYSTGCYLILEALKIPNISNNIGKVILLANTVSPGYQLNHIIDNNIECHNYYSRIDFFINGLGPLLFGCNDRIRSLSSGMVGFMSSCPYIKQYAWSPCDISYGYFGDHFSITSSRFVSKIIVPIFTETQRRHG